ncbi:chorismate lyase [Aphanothece microscopica]|uniref:chorismate lyase n=1 Tax=Aphanothece microscopica TaxID=1049561 RepID=UPI003984DA89
MPVAAPAPSPTLLWQTALVGGTLHDSVCPSLSGPWRLLLLGDGSPTRHLESLTGLPVEIELIAMAPQRRADDDGANPPAEVEELASPLLRRQVWLRCGDQTLAWAESWWNQALAEEHLQRRDQPIWRSLTAKRAELFREVDGLARVDAPWLADRFGRPGPFWSRHYRFFRGGQPLTVIREVFSPRLETWLGPATDRDGHRPIGLQTW